MGFMISVDSLVDESMIEVGALEGEAVPKGVHY